MYFEEIMWCGWPGVGRMRSEFVFDLHLLVDAGSSRILYHWEIKTETSSCSLGASTIFGVDFQEPWSLLVNCFNQEYRFCWRNVILMITVWCYFQWHHGCGGEGKGQLPSTPAKFLALRNCQKIFFLFESLTLVAENTHFGEI